LDRFIANYILDTELAAGPVQIFDGPAALVA
jgi:hypothetical protein